MLQGYACVCGSSGRARWHAIEELVVPRADPDTTAAGVKARAEARITDIERRIRDPRRIRHALEHLAGQCRGGEGPRGRMPSPGRDGAAAGHLR